MWKATRATTKNSFDFYIDELKKLDVKAYEWIHGLSKILMEPVYFCFSILLKKCNY